MPFMLFISALFSHFFSFQRKAMFFYIHSTTTITKCILKLELI